MPKIKEHDLNYCLNWRLCEVLKITKDVIRYYSFTTRKFSWIRFFNMGFIVIKKTINSYDD